ncbi:DUF885 domain-containing protein [Streptomyces sp. ST2-7A]|uniref:DUF885 domain-containing protein n=1 Tax=Streptomyces sp. ST2-7A TaxID=2907214 RepID=UPI001F26EE69|nr:DUF885 domain-containing protein [Streptomyces sp. ST2-7A]MCE7079826.1 DUF885 domain-containing protein [Streptomyces sp. ST2-7A]
MAHQNPTGTPATSTPSGLPGAPGTTGDAGTTPRLIADRYVETYADLDPAAALMMGIRPGSDLLPDFSPEGCGARAAAARDTLAELDALVPETAVADLPDVERRAARLLRERLGSDLDRDEAGEETVALAPLMTPVQRVRMMLDLTPRGDAEEWAVLARRLRRMPASLDGYRRTLAAGLDGGRAAAPRQAEAVADQLTEALDNRWYHSLVAEADALPGGGPSVALRADLAEAADLAASAATGLRDYLRAKYLPAVAGVPDGVGEERYLLGARRWTGADLDLDDAYAYGWEEYRRLRAEMIEAAGAVLPGADPASAMEYLNRHGRAVEGVEEMRVWLQEFMDRAIADLHGTHFDLPEPVRRVESMIAPFGSAAAPYYTAPSLDFSRPGRTWLPTMGETRFPLWSLVSTWYHEGVPGHHLQLAQWTYLADRLSRYQTGLGKVSASTEGWALYAERLADELGLLTDPGDRLGYLSEQMLRAMRVIIDIGMHTGRRIPVDVPQPGPGGPELNPGDAWTPELAHAFVSAYSGMEPRYITSEITRYLGVPGQAISYKLGERAWLAGRDAARAAHAARGAEFDLKAWHTAALSLGSLGLDDLADELAPLP